MGEWGGGGVGWGGGCVFVCLAPQYPIGVDCLIYIFKCHPITMIVFFSDSLAGYCFLAFLFVNLCTMAGIPDSEPSHGGLVLS